MSETFDQDNRSLRIECSIAETDVVVTSVTGTDRVSAPFLFHVTLTTSADDPSVFKLLGQTVTVWLDNLSPEDRRPIHGRVRRLTGPTREIRNYSTWRAEIVPQLSFLDYTADLRIFQSMSVPDILKKVFGEHELSDFELRGLMGTYPSLDYCVQYRESAFNFVSRLMEHVGLFYWHEHTDTSHKLVIADFNKMVTPALKSAAVRSTKSQLSDVSSLQFDYKFRSGKWTQADYDFETPTKNLKVQEPTVITEPAMVKYEVYDYPGLYKNQNDGASLTRARIQQQEAGFKRVTGVGYRALLGAGRQLVIEPESGGAPTDEDKFVLVEVEHTANEPLTLLDSNAVSSSYENRFVGVPVANNFRPDRTTPKPTVCGIETAQVLGPSGEKIHCDKYGRVKIRFFWDRNPDGKTDDNRTCWVRVAQTDAHKGWGSMCIPRIGEEVIVAFMHGDPDSPVIIGSLYNGDHPTPFELPAHKTMTGYRGGSVKR